VKGSFLAFEEEKNSQIKLRKAGMHVIVAALGSTEIFVLTFFIELDTIKIMKIIFF
jgi:hypothetical protein